MEKRDPKGQTNYFFNEEGQNQVSEQIMVAYNSGFIEQSIINDNLDDQGEAEEEVKE